MALVKIQTSETNGLKLIQTSETPSSISIETNLKRTPVLFQASPCSSVLRAHLGAGEAMMEGLAAGPHEVEASA